MKRIAWDFDGTIINIFDTWKIAIKIVCHDKNLAIPDDKEIKFINVELQNN